jgi:hypothetical protein
VRDSLDAEHAALADLREVFELVDRAFARH